MPHDSTVPLSPFLHRLLELHIDQERKDVENLQAARDRLRTLWDTAVPIVLAKVQVAGVNTESLRLHLVRRKFDGIHWPNFAGKTGAAFQAEFRASPLGGVESSTPLSSELARLDGEGFGRELAERLRLDYPQEINGILAEFLPGEPASASRAPNTAGAQPLAGQQEKRRKRSTERGEGRAKLIAALTKHHQYADGSRLHAEPIGNNELARLAEVDQATASAFFKKAFKGHAQYKAMCADAGSLIAALKLLNGEYAPHLLYGSTPPGKDESDTEQ